MSLLSSMLLSLMRWPTQQCAISLPTSVRKFRRATNRRRKRSALFKRPKSRSGGRSSRQRTSGQSESVRARAGAYPSQLRGDLEAIGPRLTRREVVVAVGRGPIALVEDVLDIELRLPILGDLRAKTPTARAAVVLQQLLNAVRRPPAAPTHFS